jgi:hypothetical protein
MIDWRETPTRLVPGAGRDLDEIRITPERLQRPIVDALLGLVRAALGLIEREHGVYLSGSGGPTRAC